MMEKSKEMYQCQMQSCGYIYNPEKGCKKGKIPKDVSFEDLPDDYRCPLCKARKQAFKPI